VEIPKNKYLKLFADCIPVKGARRSTICDLKRGKFHFIPNDLYNLLSDFNGTKISVIFKFYGKENQRTVEKYFSFLLNAELIFFCNKKEMEFFPNLNLDWDIPSLIHNAIIDIDDESSHCFEKIFLELETISCQHIQLRSFSIKTIDYFEKTLNLVLSSRFRSFEIITNYHQSFTKSRIKTFCNNHRRVRLLVIHSSPHNQYFISKFGTQIKFITEKIFDESCCGIIIPNYFTANIALFSESQKFNTCLNRKVSFDKKGNIKNCPSMSNNFGKLDKSNLLKIINSSGFNALWNVNKSQIDVCKDCEFRHLCTDCRAYTVNPESKFSKPLKCKYDPYSTTWSS